MNKTNLILKIYILINGNTHFEGEELNCIKGDKLL